MDLILNFIQDYFKILIPGWFVAGFVLSKIYKAKFSKNFLFAEKGFLDLPIILCLLIVAGFVFGPTEEGAAWKELRNELTGGHHFKELSGTEAQLLVELNEKINPRYPGYKLTKWQIQNCAYPSTSKSCDNTENDIYKEALEGFRLMKAEPNKYWETQEHFLNPFGYKNDTGKYILLGSYVSIILLLLIHISASSLIWGLIQTIVRLPIMAVLGWPLILAAIAASFASKGIKKVAVSEAISAGIKKAKDEKKGF